MNSRYIFIHYGTLTYSIHQRSTNINFNNYVGGYILKKTGVVFVRGSMGTDPPTITIGPFNTYLNIYSVADRPQCIWKISWTLP